MKRDTVNYTLVGAVVLMALLGLLAAMLAMTGRGGRSVRYFATYEDVTGLKRGAPVFYEGFRVGQVGDIEPQQKPSGTEFKVGLDVRPDWKIPQDSIARLQSTGLLADVAIGIREGQAKTLIAPGGVLKSQGNADLFAALNALAGELTTLTRSQIAPLVDSLGKRADSIATELDTNTPALMKDARGLLQRMNRAADSINEVLSENNKRAIDHTLRDTEASMASIRTLTGEMLGTRKELDRLLGQLNDIAKENRPEIQQAVADLAQITSALATRIDSIAHHLESASRNADEFTREIRRSPNRLLFTPKADQVVPEE